MIIYHTQPIQSYSPTVFPYMYVYYGYVVYFNILFVVTCFHSSSFHFFTVRVHPYSLLQILSNTNIILHFVISLFRPPPLPPAKKRSKVSGIMEQGHNQTPGVLVFAGCGAWSMAGRSGHTSKWDGRDADEHTCWGFHRIGPFVNPKKQILHVFSGCAASHTVVIDTDRRAYIWGRNEDGQLGLGDNVNRYRPTPVLPNERIKSGSCGPNHTMLFTTMGALYGAGKNDSAQLGIGNTISKTSFVRVELAEIISVACGRDFTAAVNADGEIYTWGHPEYGQLGNGGEYKTLEKAGKWTYRFTKDPTRVDSLAGVSMSYVSSGPNHTAVSFETLHRPVSLLSSSSSTSSSLLPLICRVTLGIVRLTLLKSSCAASMRSRPRHCLRIGT